MTTKHVVADDLLGQVSRKQWELTRRLLEGTLDPHRVLQSLQQIVEGRSVTLPIENTGFTVGSQICHVAVHRNRNFFHLFLNTCPHVRNNVGLTYGQTEEPTKYELKVPRQKGSDTAALCLAQAERTMSLTDMIKRVQASEYQLADAWEATAYAANAPIFHVVAEGEPSIYILGTKCRWEPQKPHGTERDFFLRFDWGGQWNEEKKWQLDTTSEWQEHNAVHKGSYVLLKRL